MTSKKLFSINQRLFTKKHNDSENLLIENYINLSDIDYVLKSDVSLFYKFNTILTYGNVSLFYKYLFLTLFSIGISVYQGFLYKTLIYISCESLLSMLIAECIAVLFLMYVETSKVLYNNTLIDYYRIRRRVEMIYPDIQWMVNNDYDPICEMNRLLPYILTISILNHLLFGSFILSMILIQLCLFAVGYLSNVAIQNKKRTNTYIKDLYNNDMLLIPSYKMDNSCILNRWYLPIIEKINTIEDLFKWIL